MRHRIGGLAILIGMIATGVAAAPHSRYLPVPAKLSLKLAALAGDGGMDRGERSAFLVYNAAAFGPGAFDAGDVVDYVLLPVEQMPEVRVTPPEALPGQSYGVWITGPSRALGVENGSRWITCRLLADIHRGSQTYTTGPMAVIVVRFTAMTCRDSPGVRGNACPKTYSIFDPQEVEKRYVSSLLHAISKRVTTDRAGRSMDRPPSSFEI